MVSLFNFDEDLIYGFVREFAEYHAPGSEHAFACIYRSSDYPDTRQVFRVSTKGQDFALKVDTQSPETGRLTKEFDLLCQLHRLFSDHDKVAIVDPIYKSPGGQFFVTRHIDRKTATEMIYADIPDNRAAQVYRRAGQWLHVLHDFKPRTQVRFWYQWMFETIDQTLSDSTPQARPEEFRPMLEQQQRDAETLKDIRDVRVFSHGDFHGRNLIQGPGVTYGLDFTEATEKLAVYDIVDFMKVDVFRDAPPDVIDRSGLIAGNKEMFFKLYRQPINHDLLDFSMRARLLMDWLAISQEIYANSAFQRKKFERLRSRVILAFQKPF